MAMVVETTSEDRLEGHALGCHQLLCSQLGSRKSLASELGQLPW